MITALAFLRRIPILVWLLLAIVGAAGAAAWRVQTAHRKAIALAVDSATTHTRDSVSTAAKAVADAALRTSTLELGALREVYAQQQRATQHLQRTIAGKAATDSLYAAKARLSVAAKADTTVAVFVAASDSVAAENGHLKADATTLIAAVAETELRARAVHAADTAAIRGLSGEVVAVRDSLAVEASKPKRSLKSTLTAGAGGVLFYEGVKVILKLVKGR